jgi:Tetracyclin repressor-like, C-terminal domain
VPRAGLSPDAVVDLAVGHVDDHGAAALTLAAVAARAGVAVRSAAHGFAVLEAAGGFGFPEDLDASYERLIDMITAGLRSL